MDTIYAPSKEKTDLSRRSTRWKIFSRQIVGFLVRPRTLRLMELLVKEGLCMNDSVLQWMFSCFASWKNRVGMSHESVELIRHRTCWKACWWNGNKKSHLVSNNMLVRTVMLCVSWQAGDNYLWWQRDKEKQNLPTYVGRLCMHVCTVNKVSRKPMWEPNRRDCSCES